MRKSLRAHPTVKEPSMAEPVVPQAVSIPLDQIRPNPWNHHMVREGYHDELGDSLAAEGQINLTASVNTK